LTDGEGRREMKNRREGEVRGEGERTRKME
jgi:hypothetical protein